MTIKEFFSFKKNRFFWANLLAMIVVACVLVFAILQLLSSYTRHGQAIVVPEAKGLTIGQAEKLFRDKGLKYVVSDSMYVKDKPAGSILEYTPSSGQKVKKGRTIYLTINTLNVPMQAVPDVADNSSLRQAQARILASGFRLTENQFIRGQKDWVYGVIYQGRELELGDKVPVGATLTLVVGDGAGEEYAEADSITVATEDSVVDESWF